jgi:hypothetical protein
LALTPTRFEIGVSHVEAKPTSAGKIDIYATPTFTTPPDPTERIMNDGEAITATTDGFLMAVRLIERIQGVNRGLLDDALRDALRQIVEGRLTLIDDELLRRAKGNPLLDRFTNEERHRATLILEGLEVLGQ